MRVQLTLLIGLLGSAASAARTTTSTVVIVTIGDGSCDSVVKIIRRSKTAHPEVSLRLAALYTQDQIVRSGPKIDWAKVAPQDRRHRLEVNAFLQQRKLYSAADFYRAAMVFQHGNCPAHYKLARELADEAVKLGSKDARWLYAAATDRYLRSINRPQKYGTQYLCTGAKAELQPYDPATTDAERARYGVPTLQEALRRTHDTSCH